MNELQIFNNPQFGEIRTINKNGQPWFVAADVCKALEIDRTQTRRLDDDEKGVCSIQTPGGKQELNAVNEPGLYSLVLGSRKPEAKAFKRWITHEVIPSIRATGAYMTPETLEMVLLNPDTIIGLAQRLKATQAEIKALEEQSNRQQQLIGELQPKADYLDYILSSIGTMTSGQIAADYSLTAQKLNKILHEEHIHHKVGGQWILYQEHMGMGYTKSETIGFTRTDGRPDTKLFTRWTQKGRLLINEILNRRGIYANMDLVEVSR